MAPRATTKSKSKGGRPPALDRIVAQREVDGAVVNVTAAERIIELVRIGMWVERACATVGINKGTFYGWLKIAATARSLTLADSAYTLTPHQQACIEFSNAIDEAEAGYEAQAFETLHLLEQGFVREKTIEKYELDTDGNERMVERRVERSRAEPSAWAISWKLARRFPDRYVIKSNDGAAESAPDAVLTPSTTDEMIGDVEHYLNELA